MQYKVHVHKISLPTGLNRITWTLDPGTGGAGGGGG